MATPSIADLLEATSRELAGTDARVYRRVGEHLQRTTQALKDLQSPSPQAADSPLALLRVRGKKIVMKGGVGAGPRRQRFCRDRTRGAG
jgi:hypothetical protein